jgi:hypothetical protein
MVFNKTVEPLSFYPIQLVQVSTRGLVHNRSPTKATKVIPATEETTEKAVDFYRFYFDGLVVHIACQSSDDGETERLGPLCVGNDEQLYVSTVTYEASEQMRRITHIMRETYTNWPHAHKL